MSSGFKQSKRGSSYPNTTIKNRPCQLFNDLVICQLSGLIGVIMILILLPHFIHIPNANVAIFVIAALGLINNLKWLMTLFNLRSFVYISRRFGVWLLVSLVIVIPVIVFNIYVCDLFLFEVLPELKR